MEHPQNSVTGIDTRETLQQYTWRDIFGLALKHKPRLVRANLLAIMATVMSVPVPLLLPVLVDEVLLDEPGPVLPVMDSVLPGSWETPVVYIGLMVVAAFLLRVAALSFNVLQSREFSKVSKDVVFRSNRLEMDTFDRVGLPHYNTDYVLDGNLGRK